MKQDNKKLLICGSFNEPIDEKALLAIESIIRQLLEEDWMIMNADGSLLGDAIGKITSNICTENNLLMSERYLHCDASNAEQMIEDAAPDICLFIKGRHDADHDQWNAAKAKEIPCIGLPGFGMLGLVIYEFYEERYKSNTVVNKQYDELRLIEDLNLGITYLVNAGPIVLNCIEAILQLKV
jgi:hypothetical protein